MIKNISFEMQKKKKNPQVAATNSKTIRRKKGKEKKVPRIYLYEMISSSSKIKLKRLIFSTVSESGREKQRQ